MDERSLLAWSDYHPGGPSWIDILTIVVASVACLALIAGLAFVIGRPLSKRLIGRAKAGTPSMTMSFVVGSHEKHSVVIRYYQSVSILVVDVDGDETFDGSFATGVKLSRSASWTIGDGESHLLQVEKTRERFLPAAKPQVFIARVDGIQIAQATSRA